MVRRVTVLIGAILMMIFSIYQTQEYVRKNLEEIEIVVAKAPLKANSKIKPEHIGSVKVPKKGVHPDTVRLKEEIVGLYTTTDILPEEPILSSKVTTIEESSSAHLLNLSPQQRIIAIVTDLTKSVGGIIKSGDYVDLISVSEGREGSQPSAKTFLQGVEVIDIRDANGRKLSEIIDVKDNQIIATNNKLVPSAVLLAVNSNQAEAICLYQKVGDIVLVLNPKRE